MGQTPPKVPTLQSWRYQAPIVLGKACGLLRVTFVVRPVPFLVAVLFLENRNRANATDEQVWLPQEECDCCGHTFMLVHSGILEALAYPN